MTVHPDEEQVQKDVDRAFVYYPAREFPLLARYSQHS